MTVMFFGNVQDHTAGEKSIDCDGAPCVRALIDWLGERFGEGFKEFLLGDDTCFFLVNGSGILTSGGLDTQLREGDTVEVLPFVEGG